VERDSPSSVVIVDDAPEVRGLVRTQLKLSGRFVVVGEGRTGTEAVELCRDHQPDIVLLDVSMPDMDGLEALSKIREVAPQARVVMYTGFEESGLGDRARELGAAALIEKSTDVGSLVDQLSAIRDTAPHENLVRAGDQTDIGADDRNVLHDHLERFREVFEEAAIGMATMTLTGRIVRANKALAEAVDRKISDLVGLPYHDLAPLRDLPVISSGLREAQNGAGRIVEFEHEVESINGSRRLLVTTAPVRDGRGRPLYLFAQVQDISAQRWVEEELRRSEQRFRLLVEAVQDYAIFMLDPTGHIVSWNAGAERIKGYTSEEIVGQHFRVFYPPDVQAVGHPEHELEVALSRGHYEEEGWRIRKDGSRFWASVVITAVHNKEGRHIGFAKVTRDIDERRQMLLEARRNAEALAAANAELGQANARLAQEAAEQAEFIAVTAHELRTPIGVLSGSAKLLVDHLNELSEADRADLTASMVTSAARLQRLLNDLLTAARLESQSVHLDRHDIELSALLNRAVATARTAIPDADIVLEVPPSVRVNADPDRLAQAMDNLLANALRYGRPPVVVHVREFAERVEIVVSDEGPGVPADLQQRLFERFTTGTARGGTGLGLYIVRELVRAHGGDARYDTDAEGRACFVLSLPR
jgi:PAS domain S-box-containing protein